MRYLTWRDDSAHLSSARSFTEQPPRWRVPGRRSTPPSAGRSRLLQPPLTTRAFDDALRQIKAAGYDATGLLTTKDEPFIAAEATPNLPA
jgi:hypothetical protein